MKTKGEYGFLVSVYDFGPSPAHYFYPTLESARAMRDYWLHEWVDEGWHMVLTHQTDAPGERLSEVYRDLDGELMAVALNELVPDEKFEVDLAGKRIAGVLR